MTDLHQPVDLGEIIVGVDTHKDTHVAVAIDPLGRRLAQQSVSSNHAGLLSLLAWSRELSTTRTWGVEGTGSYGAGLTRLLTSSGEPVHEVSRPNRRLRRERGKSDPIDAEAAARSVLAEQSLVAPKADDTASESLRQLRDSPRVHDGQRSFTVVDFETTRAPIPKEVFRLIVFLTVDLRACGR